MEELKNELTQEEMWEAEEHRRVKDSNSKIDELSREVEELMRHEAEMCTMRANARTEAVSGGFG